MLKRMSGLGQVPLIIGLVIMAIAVPVATKLAEQSQDTRKSASLSLTYRCFRYDCVDDDCLECESKEYDTYASDTDSSGLCYKKDWNRRTKNVCVVANPTPTVGPTNTPRPTVTGPQPSPAPHPPTTTPGTITPTPTPMLSPCEQAGGVCIPSNLECVGNGREVTLSCYPLAPGKCCLLVGPTSALTLTPTGAPWSSLTPERCLGENASGCNSEFVNVDCCSGLVCNPDGSSGDGICVSLSPMECSWCIDETRCKSDCGESAWKGESSYCSEPGHGCCECDEENSVMTFPNASNFSVSPSTVGVGGDIAVSFDSSNVQSGDMAIYYRLKGTQPWTHWTRGDWVVAGNAVTVGFVGPDSVGVYEVGVAVYNTTRTLVCSSNGKIYNVENNVVGSATGATCDNRMATLTVEELPNASNFSVSPGTVYLGNGVEVSFISSHVGFGDMVIYYRLKGTQPWTHWTRGTWDVQNSKDVTVNFAAVPGSVGVYEVGVAVYNAERTAVCSSNGNVYRVENGDIKNVIGACDNSQTSLTVEVVPILPNASNFSVSPSTVSLGGVKVSFTSSHVASGDMVIYYRFKGTQPWTHWTRGVWVVENNNVTVNFAAVPSPVGVYEVGVAVYNAERTAVCSSNGNVYRVENMVVQEKIGTCDNSQASLTVETAPGRKCISCTNGADRSRGDANCDGEKELDDVEIWRMEYFEGGLGSEVRDSWKADFGCDGKVDIHDRDIWREQYVLNLGS